MPATNQEHVVEIENLSRRFGKTIALDGVSLSAPAGCVYGLVGANGSGKTTLIKHVLGLLRAKAGSVRIFGLDPVEDPVGVLGRIGYLSEERDLPEWMRIDELMQYTHAHFPKWDQAYADEMCRAFGLDASALVKDVSRGQRAQVGLIVAVAHRPDLLVLDEPSSGLDAVIRRDILGEIIRMVADEGRTVLFSSHLLDEVELMSDYVAMIDDGKVVLRGALDDIKGCHHHLTIQFGEAREHAPSLAGALAVTGEGRAWTAVCNGALDDLREEVSRLGGTIRHSRHASLEEIFVARVGKRYVAVREG